jgi:hypothetical protein
MTMGAADRRWAGDDEQGDAIACSQPMLCEGLFFSFLVILFVEIISIYYVYYVAGTGCEPVWGRLCTEPTPTGPATTHPTVPDRFTPVWSTVV